MVFFHLVAVPGHHSAEFCRSPENFTQNLFTRLTFRDARPIFARIPGLSGQGVKDKDRAMKVRNSLKSLKGRHRDNRVIRRKGRVYVINKTNRRFKARQG